MAYGLQVWNASGGQILEIDDSLVRYVGTITHTRDMSITVNNYYYRQFYMNIPGWRNDGTWFYVYKGLGNFSLDEQAVSMFISYTLTPENDQIGIKWTSQFGSYYAHTLYFDILRI